MLRGVALRVTRPRVAVLSAVHEHPHADTAAIIDVVREDLSEVSHQAVYDVLRALTAAGLVRCIQPPGSVARYEARVRTTTTTSCAGPAVLSRMSTARSATAPA
jgi:Fe2+ or Zn2+ uptake regulation protein